MILKEKLNLLIELQECDSQLIKMDSKKRDLPEKIKKLDDRFLLFKEETEQNKRKHDELKARHAESESKIKKLNDGMVKTKERLLEVKNNKEYQAMLKEIETAEAARSDVETEIIKLLDEMDKLSSLVKKDQETLDEYKKKYDEEKKVMEKELASIDNDFITWEKRRDQVKTKVPTELLSQYERVRNRNNGIGVISVWKAVCNGCHMNIPPQLYNELQKSSELLSCPNCNRIMYFQNMEKPV
jgi:uncharacterized protein